MSDKVPWSDTSTPCCCDECPAPVLTCQSRSASKSKCGYRKEGDPEFYLQWTHCVDGKRRTDTYTIDGDGNCNESQGSEVSDINCCGGFHNDADGKNYAHMYQPSDGSVDTDYCHGSCSGSLTTQLKDDCSYDSIWNSTSSLSCNDPEGFNYSCTGRTETDGSVYVTATFNGETQPEAPGSCVDCWLKDVQYSSPLDPPNEYGSVYTTDDLIAKVRAAFDDWTGSSCSSVRNLPEEEGSYTERQARYKITLGKEVPSGQRLKIQIWTTSTPEGGSPTSTESWVTIEAGDKETEWTDIDVPASNGENSVEIGTYYCESNAS